MRLRTNVYYSAFQTLRSRGFHDLIDHYLWFFFQNIMNTVNRSLKHYAEFFQIFRRCSLGVFHQYKMSMGLYNGRKPVAQI